MVFKINQNIANDLEEAQVKMDSGSGGQQKTEPEERAPDERAPNKRALDERAPDFGIGKVTNESVMKELFYREEHKG